MVVRPGTKLLPLIKNGAVAPWSIDDGEMSEMDGALLTVVASNGQRP